MINLRKVFFFGGPGSGDGASPESLDLDPHVDESLA